ncbi:DNA polymerase [Algicola sagamiensis]|uniref:DNA polymerase n=1 Tax=Algicola sagamiensis TaxID=163869 RepID=UPI00039EBCAE|nr:DNA polymerase [Algicola sagamiensis]
MQTVSLDFETYSEFDLKSGGVWGYSKHESTALLCMAYAYGDEEPQLWLPGEALPEFVRNPTQFMLCAWNSFFEWCLWHHTMGWPEAPIANWTDTAAHAAALALPRSLEGCGKAIGLPSDQQKDKQGKRLIQMLCKPFRGKRIQDPDMLRSLYDYCKQDVVAERAIGKLLRPLSAKERQVWELDQKINIRGMCVDMEAVGHARAMMKPVKETLNDEVKQLTNGELQNVSQIGDVKQYIRELGYPLEAFNKEYLAQVMKDPKLPELARRLIEIRQQTGKTSLAKYTTLEKVVSDGRAHGLLAYHGASTGRWSGRLFQPHNLPRSSFKGTDTCIALFQYRDPELLQILYAEPLEALSSCIRGMLTASEGKRLLVVDYAAIEARVLPWLAGQDDILDVFRGHGKIYEYTATQIYNIPLEQVTSEQRFIGKIATLALGYQGGSKAFLAMAMSYDVDIPEALAERVKNDWRQSNKRIVSYWYNIERAAIKAVAEPGLTFQVRNVAFHKIGSFLMCRLPSGRTLSYYAPSLKEGKFGAPQIHFWGVHSESKKWMELNTYGGKLVENIAQAVARDLMADAMLRLEKAGYEIILTVHDEIIGEADIDFGSLNEFESLMCQTPDWADGLPIAVEGFEALRYRK